MAAQFFGYIGSRCLSTRQTNQTVDLFVCPLFWPVHCWPYLPQLDATNARARPRRGAPILCVPQCMLLEPSFSDASILASRFSSSTIATRSPSAETFSPAGTFLCMAAPRPSHASLSASARSLSSRRNLVRSVIGMCPSALREQTYRNLEARESRPSLLHPLLLSQEHLSVISSPSPSAGSRPACVRRLPGRRRAALLCTSCRDLIFLVRAAHDDLDRYPDCHA